MIRKTALCFCVVLFAVFLFGCSAIETFSNDSQEYIVSSVGFDEMDGLIKITMEILVVNADDLKEGKEKRIFTATGDSVKEAYNKIATNTTQPITLTHNGIVAIGANIASQRLEEILSFCGSESQFNVGTMFVYTENCQQLLNQQPISSVAVGYDILSMLEVKTAKTGVNLHSRFYEIQSVLKKKNKTFYIPVISLEKESFFIDGMAVFKEKRFICDLKQQEMQLMGFLTDRISKGEFILSGHDFTVDYSKTTYGFRLSNKLECTVNLRLKAKGDRELLRVKLTEMLESLRKFHGDIFGFGNIIYQKHPEIFEKIEGAYEEYFASAKFRVNIYE